MALDNPSYFSVAKDSPHPSTSRQTSRKGSTASGLEAASCLEGRPLTLNIGSPLNSTFSQLNSSPHGSISSPHNSSKKGLRSLLRSVSSNSADSNQELFIMGEPRLMDIAPDLQGIKYPNAEPRRSNSLKNRSEIGAHQDVLYSPLPTSEENANDVSDEEVFINEDSARYYNFNAPPNNPRRHSIGTFMARERTSSNVSSNKSFKDDRNQPMYGLTNDDLIPEMPATDDHALRHASFPRKRCLRCTKGPIKKSGDMDDILIVSFKNSPAATLWVDYFTSYFEQFSRQANRKKFKVLHVGIEEIVESNGEIAYIAEKTAAVKLQLIIICPSLLEHISMHLEPSTALGKLITTEKALALLLGVTDDNITDVHKKAFPTYSSWQRLSVGEDQDTNFASNFLSTAMTIFTKVWKKQSSVVTQEKTQFSIAPKKVRPGHTSVVILLQYPLQRDDVIKVSIEKNNELMEIGNIKRRNPYTLKMNIPESYTEISAIVNIHVEKNGNIIGSRPIKCESRLRELEQILRSTTNPIHFMCQALGFSPQDKEQLDNCMHHLFLKNLPPNFNLLGTQTTFGNGHKHSCEEFPTLLHFAAKFGLEKLTLELLDCPGGDLACDIRNNCNLNPADLAENAGHINVAHHLRGHMKMNEFTSVYTKLKEISLNPEKQVNVEEADVHYLSPRSADEVYKICPPPRPVNFVTSPTEDQRGYMEMNLKKPVIKKSSPKLHLSIENLTRDSPTFKNHATDHKSPSESLKSPSESLKSPCSDISKMSMKSLCEDKVQTELLEIINDFKNNVHSIAQAEKLVEEWKNRNDVQKSFKEKQEQLNEMRIRYEKMQQDMKCGTKKNNPFDRFVNLFTRNKSKDDEKHIISTPQTVTILPSQRPISSLSLQSTSSSGSSGRMSTISGCSIGDSGTHSDHEDRKTVINSSCDEDFPSELNKAIMNQNYIVPPAPKPVKNLCRQNVFATIEERPPQPIPRPDHLELNINSLSEEIKNDEECVYLSFEPQREQDYMNIINVSSEDQGHEYMNFSAPR